MTTSLRGTCFDRRPTALRALLVAAGGVGVGLGHLARSTALAQALELRGAEVCAHVIDSTEPATVDGLVWAPTMAPAAAAADLLVLDGYGIGTDHLAAVGGMPRFWMHPPPAALADDRHLRPLTEAKDLRFASLRRDYW